MQILKPCDLPVINGEHISLRPITEQDTELVVRWRNDPEVLRHFIYRGAFTKEVHENWLRTKVATGEVIQYIVLAFEDRRPVGSVYFRDIDPENESAEYGVFIGEADARGRGIGSEVAKLLTDFGLDVLGLHRISMRVIYDNRASSIAGKHAGFQSEGVFRDYVKLDGEFKSVEFLARVATTEGVSP